MSWKNKTLMIGAIGGLMAGLAAAAFFIRSAAVTPRIWRVLNNWLRKGSECATSTAQQKPR